MDRRRGARACLGPARQRLGEGVLCAVWLPPLQPPAGRGAAAEHSDVGVRHRSRRAPGVPSVRRLRGAMGADTRGRASALRRERRQPQVSLDACVAKMEAEGLPPIAIETFAQYYRQPEAGANRIEPVEQNTAGT